MNRLPECDHCEMNAQSPYLVCSLHPQGQIETCPDFSLKESSEEGEFWEPIGASYYGGDLVLQPRNYLSNAERLEMIDTHPFFTSRCPNCEMPIRETEPSRIHWDCEHCGWKDDTV